MNDCQKLQQVFDEIGVQYELTIFAKPLYMDHRTFKCDIQLAIIGSGSDHENFFFDKNGHLVAYTGNQC